MQPYVVTVTIASEENQQYVLTYELISSVEERGTVGYGVCCRLDSSCLQQNIWRVERVEDISSDSNVTVALIDFLAQHAVFPVHMREVIEDVQCGLAMLAC